MSYRTSRNLEASIIDFLTDELASSWNEVNVEKTFARVYDLDLPTLCIRVGVTSHDKVEIGGNSTLRTPQVLIDIFTTSDGQRLDLKDYLISILKAGIPYYEYVIANGQVQTKTANGRIRVLEIADTPIDFDTDKDKLDVHDRFRHLLTLTISLGQVEA